MVATSAPPKDETTELVRSLPLLELEDLEQKLKDPQRPEEFTVRVPGRLEFRPGEFIALLGPSGCGKTTLLTVLGLLRAPTDSGKLGRFLIRVSEKGKRVEFDLKQLWSKRRLSRIENIRRRFVGFALQSGELLPSLTVLENIAAPLRLNGWSFAEVKSRAEGLIAAFGLRRNLQGPSGNESHSLADARINRLSGGEYQRVSLARSIAHHPQLLFVDEPTAALNRELAHAALDQLRLLMAQGERNTATVMITHDEELAAEYADLIIRMAPMKNSNGGELVEVVKNSPTRVVNSFQ
jgi:ABC-type lipoprotein export system ATPase subunit